VTLPPVLARRAEHLTSSSVLAFLRTPMNRFWFRFGSPSIPQWMKENLVLTRTSVPIPRCKERALVSPGAIEDEVAAAHREGRAVGSPGRIQGGARESVEEQQRVAALGGPRVAGIAQPIGGHAGVRLHDVGLVGVEVGGAVVAGVSDPVSILVRRRGAGGRGDLWRQVWRGGVVLRGRLGREIGRRAAVR
jgi:hypothetical protein